MGVVLADTQSLVSVANAIRERSESSESLIFPEGFVEGIQNIKSGNYNDGYNDGHEAGYLHGKSEGYEIGYSEGFTTGETKGETEGYDRGYGEGYTKGKEDGGTFYNDFWDEYLDNGTITDCNNLFANANWTDKTFKPNHSITPILANQMFASSLITDINKSLQECEVTIDLSTGSLTRCDSLCSRANSTSCPSPINVENVVHGNGLNSMFYMNSSIQEVHFIGVKEFHTWDSSFTNAYNLKHLTIEGVVGTPFHIGMSHDLTIESVQSIIDHLKDLTGETAKTVIFSVKVKRKMTEEQIAQITAKNWTLA